MPYYGLVDMGSNGIRFSITDLSPSTQRILPTIYADRAAISLYDLQFSTAGERVPIPQPAITQVVQALLRFKATCADYNVPASQIRVVATEATRAAQNSVAFRQHILDATGWTVELLPKEEEGRIGAYGVASSYGAVNGLVMDLGGGSTQITWMTTKEGEVTMSEKGSVSMPYGAAALTRDLAAAEKQGAEAQEAYRAKVVSDLRVAIADLAIPDSLLSSPQGLSLYLSGGGFRGWGFVLMAQHAIKPYPIPIINGFHVPVSAFTDTATVTAAVASSTSSPSSSPDPTPSIFRISPRRAAQLPSTAFLIAALTTALPPLHTVYFAQGGVREGVHFASLPARTRALSPLVVTTAPHARDPASTAALVALLAAAAPAHPFSKELLIASAQALYVHAPLPKDVVAGAALRSTTTGAWAGTHGWAHAERAALCLLLCERYGGVGRLSPSEEDFYGRMVRLLPGAQAWWCLYLGRVAGVVARVYPAGVVAEGEGRVGIVAGWRGGGGKKKGKKHGDGEEAVLEVEFRFGKGAEGMGMGSGGWDEGLLKAIKGVEKVGKRKNWVGGRGWKVVVRVDGEEFEG